MSPSLTDSDSLKLLTVDEVADLFQVRARKVYDLVREGLPHVKVGRFLRFRPADLHRWQESHTAAAPNPGPATAAPALVKRDWSRRS
jgi:excisionase family DNA binding protein